MDSKQKIKALRAQLTKHKLAGYLQPLHDEYMNEYPPASNRRVEFLTGFAGSAGTAVVLQNKAAFFTDGRYTLQAKNEVDGKLYEQHNITSLMPDAWIAEKLKSGRIGYDAKLYSSSAIQRMEKTLGKKVALVPMNNLVDAIWKDRPAAPSSPLFIHDTKFSGENSASKRKRVAAQVKSQGADACVLTTPDAVDWLLNIRAHDVENSPLALATVILDVKGKAQLFIAPSRVSASVKKHLGSDVAILEPEKLEAALKKLKGKRVLCDTQLVPVWYMQVLNKAKAMVVEGQDPCAMFKAMKNKTELQGMKNAHLRDGLAVVKLLHWLDTQRGNITEMDVCDRLLEFRKQGEYFTEPSFPTIAGSGPNGAIVHYRVSEASNRKLRQDELFLLDSGGQYLDGTTDITRTVVIGTPTSEHKNAFTRVLRGHIAIAMAQFPEGTAGSQLDAMARQYLWQAGMDYDHGTGHGVGCFLNVHEGPQRISKRGGDAAFKPGMIVSNEPGYYKDGSYGIRIESLVAVVEKASLKGTKNYFGFGTITCAPIDWRLINASMLTQPEKDWLNAYHAWVYEKLAPGLDHAARGWLEAVCVSI